MLLTNRSLLHFFLLHGLALVDETQQQRGSISYSNLTTDIEVGSSLSTNGASWLSQSGRFAFGFYPEGEGFFVGIQLLLMNPSKNLVVWTAKPDLKPFSKEAFLNFTPNGFLLTPNKGGAPFYLFNFSSASSAAMIDNGNFVVYSSNSSAFSHKIEYSALKSPVPCYTRGASYYNCNPSSVGNPYSRSCSSIERCRDTSTKSTSVSSTNSTIIIWRSFDYPTDTILGSQLLGCGNNLTSSAGEKTHSIGIYQLSMQCDGNLIFHSVNSGTQIWTSGTTGDNYRTLVLDENGHLYLSTFDGIEKALSGYKPQNDQQTEMIYAARVDSDKIFRLYAVNLDNNKTTVVNEIPYYKDNCQAKDICGVNSYCLLVNNNPDCRCIPGFEYINRRARAAGCQRSHPIPIICNIGSAAGKNLSMGKVENVVGLDELAYSVVSSGTMDDCSSACIDDCDCYAAFFREQKCSKLKLPLTSGRIDQNDPSVAFFKMVAQADAIQAASWTRKREVRVAAIIICAAVSSAIWVAVVAASGGAYWLLFGRFREEWKKWELALTEEIAPRYFSYEELLKGLGPGASRRELGKGGHGTVYRVELPIGEKTVSVAVKRFHGAEGDGEKDFQAEMRLIGRAHHVNLVRLLGFCHDGLSRLLVYEFMSRGSLANHIFNSLENRPGWTRRVELLLGAARGIYYLHCECETKIIHRDIKPENILIAEDWTVKISDFGLSKFLIANQTRAATFTFAAGTEGYVAPECEREVDGTGAVMLTEKADVYSYGVVVLETVCSRRNREAKLCDLARAHYDAGEMEKLLDGEQVEASDLERVVKVAILCVQEEPDERPSMEDVVMMLEGVIDVPSPAPLPLLGQTA